jgi:hypothetical protein
MTRDVFVWVCPPHTHTGHLFSGLLHLLGALLKKLSNLYSRRITTIGKVKDGQEHLEHRHVPTALSRLTAQLDPFIERHSLWHIAPFDTPGASMLCVMLLPGETSHDP